MKLVKYFLSKKPVTILLLVLVLAGGLLAYVKMGKLEDAPFTIKQALVLTPYPGIIRKSKFPQNPKRSVRFSGKRTKRSVQKRKARNTQKAETKVL